jgi:phage shock protein A
MSAAEVAALPFASSASLEEAVVELRRQAAVAVAHQRRLRDEAAAVRARAAAIEAEARRALARGGERSARQVLAQGLSTLEARAQLDRDIEGARRSVAALLATLVRTENRAWGLRAPARLR